MCRTLEAGLSQHSFGFFQSEFRLEAYREAAPSKETATAPGHRPWMWTSNEHKSRPPAFGYEATREAAMAAFAKRWRRE
jgi:hypothetical protein